MEFHELGIGVNIVKNHDQEFKCLGDRTYLDHAGATLYSSSQLAAVQADLARHLYGNPHTRSLASRHATDAVDLARFRLLQHFGTSGDEYSVIFTSGATGALSLLADTFQFNGTYDAPGSFVYITECHTSVLGMRAKVPETVSVSALAPEEAAQLLSGGDCDNVQNETNGGLSSECADDLSEPSGVRRGLFAYAAQCNFSGCKYPLDWVTAARVGALDGLTSGRRVRGGPHVPGCRWYCLLDAASYVATNPLDLTTVTPDFVCMSFYKIFGYPTGLGALLVHRRAWHTLEKRYFGGGAVEVSLAGSNFHVPRAQLHERMEDGTVSYLAIAAVTAGLETIRRLAGDMCVISRHVFSLAQYTYHHLSALKYTNGSPAVRIYSDRGYDDIRSQGGIIAFNLLRPDGEYYGSTEVEKFAGLYDIDLRTGCFCNPGACQRFLGHSDQTVRQHFQAGHVCGDETDLIDGAPTGACRVSFGYMSRRSDAGRLIDMIQQCFVDAVGGVSGGRPTIDGAYAVLNRAVGADGETEDIEGTSGAVEGSCGADAVRAVRSDSFRARTRIDSTNRDASVEGFDSDCQEARAWKPLGERSQIGNKCGEPVDDYYTAEVDAEGEVWTDASDTPVKTITISGSSTSDSLSSHADPTLHRPQVATQALHHPAPAAVHLPSGSALAPPGSSAHLSQIVLYPVKSCAGFSVAWWPLGARGLLYDRHWMVVSAGGSVLTQKRQPRLCRVRPEVHMATGRLLLRADGYADLSLPLETGSGHPVTSSDLCESRVCGDRVGGVDCGVAVADWLSDVLGEDGVRLVRQAADSDRMSKLKGASGQLSLANESPYLLLNVSSVRALRDDVRARDVTYAEREEELMARFRGNLIVDGLPAYQEDSMRSIIFANSVQMQVSGGCSRCQMVGVDQASGQRSRQPLPTLSSTRGRRMLFGVHLSVAPHSPPNALLAVHMPVSWETSGD